jgi:serine/threonine protein kinase
MAKHGRYKIVRRVADGGMAEIFLATQLGREGFQKPVILKRIHSTIYADPQFRNMFIDEAHISMGLSHSNIVQILDLGMAAGRYFLVLELVDGWDLGRVLQRAAAAGTPLPRELGLYIAADVCRALAYAHGKADGDRPMGIVHRDISPHNILLSDQGEVKLTDFGIAKAMNKREQTGTGVVKGKVAFMSPEQAMGKPTDARSDIFSLGTVLYLLMTRQRPFEGPTDLETLLRVQKGDFNPPEAVAPELPPEVAAIINRAMRRDPGERYPTAEEMLGDLEQALRTVFRPVGQTELKRWLAALSAKDGVQPIVRSAERSVGARTGTGTGELDGKDVVLSDSQEIREEDVDGDAITSLAVVEGGADGRVRLNRQRPTHSLLPVPDDGEGAMGGRGSRMELALPVPEGDERPGRPRARRGSGLSILIVAALLIAGAWLAGKYARVLWPDGSGAGKAAADGGGGATEATAGAEATAGTNDRQAQRAAAAADASAGAKATAGGEPDDRERGAGAMAQRHGADSAPPREPAGHHARPGDRPSGERPQKDYMRDLKGMLAPDPSQLPSPPTAQPPSQPPTSPTTPAAPRESAGSPAPAENP